MNLNLGNQDKEWTRWAIGVLQGDANRSADTHLIPLDFNGLTEMIWNSIDVMIIHFERPKCH